MEVTVAVWAGQRQRGSPARLTLKEFRTSTRLLQAANINFTIGFKVIKVFI